MNEKREVISLFCRNYLFRLHLDDSFEDFHKWLKTLPHYQKLKEKAKNVVKELLDEKINDWHCKKKTSVVGFAKERHNGMKRSGISNDLSSIDNFRKFIAYLVVIQEGKGYTSHLCVNCDLFELDFTSGDENQWSPEHLDETKIYSISNVVLNTLHFQSSTQNPKSNISDEYKELINAGGKDICDVPDKVEDYVVDKVYRKLIGDLPDGIWFSENQNAYKFKKLDGTRASKVRRVKRIGKEKGRKLILEDFKKIRPNDWKKYQEKIQLGWEYDFYHCREYTKNGENYIIYRSIYDPMYMTIYNKCFEIHELSYILADTQKGSAQWYIKKFKQFQNKNFCDQEESKERKEQISNFIIELDEFITEFKNNNEFPRVKKTPIVYKIIHFVISCISHTKDRNETIIENNEKNNENKKEQDILSKKDLFILITNEIREHRLRCFYSNVKMSFSEMRFDFALSPERLNNDLGYIKGNLKLICKEFNTGYRQWSRELFNKTFRC